MDRRLLGTELRRIRLQANMTLEALASASGVSVRGIGDLERGLRQPRASTLTAIADALDLQGTARASLLQAPAADAPLHATALPPRPEHFTGRGAELAAVGRALADAHGTDLARSVVISGASGFGKTALALEAVCARPTDPVVYADATGFDASRSSVRGLLSLLLAQTGSPAAADFVGTVRAWRTVTAAQARVTILDNAASEALARSVISAQTGGAVLLTSRRPLQGLEGAVRVRVGPLPLDEAARLLESALGPAASSSSAALAELCDGIPGALAVAVGIANSHAHDAESVVRMLAPRAGRLRALTTPQASMIIGLQNSYSLLGVEAAAVLRVIAERTWAAITATAVSSRTGRDGLDVEDALDELVDYGLLEPAANGYRLLELVRLFAQGLL